MRYGVKMIEVLALWSRQLRYVDDRGSNSVVVISRAGLEFAVAKSQCVREVVYTKQTCSLLFIVL